jgi:hypothetical protein
VSSAPLAIISIVLGSEDQATRVLAALHAVGYVCVPREPTDEMLEAGWAPAHVEDAKETWEQMIAAFLSTKPEIDAD